MQGCEDTRGSVGRRMSPQLENVGLWDETSKNLRLVLADLRRLSTGHRFFGNNLARVGSLRCRPRRFQRQDIAAVNLRD